MVFTRFRRWRRRRLLARPFPAEWLPYLEQLEHYRRLGQSEQSRLRDDLRVFIAEKNWEGCGGLDLNDEIRVTIAAFACMLLLGLEHDYFSGVQSILVYPSEFVVPVREPIGPTVLEGESFHLGEAWYRGPVILSWDEIAADVANPGTGQNLVWHEFAHQLDMLNAAVDGTPPLPTRQLRERWREVMSVEQRRLRRADMLGRPTLLDPYGAEDAAEFFAVATEAFFDQPLPLAAEHPELYDLLRGYYRQDPASRWRDEPPM